MVGSSGGIKGCTWMACHQSGRGTVLPVGLATPVLASTLGCTLPSPTFLPGDFPSGFSRWRQWPEVRGCGSSGFASHGSSGTQVPGSVWAVVAALWQLLQQQGHWANYLMLNKSALNLVTCNSDSHFVIPPRGPEVD